MVTIQSEIHSLVHNLRSLDHAFRISLVILCQNIEPSWKIQGILEFKITSTNLLLQRGGEIVLGPHHITGKTKPSSSKNSSIRATKIFFFCSYEQKCKKLVFFFSCFPPHLVAFRVSYEHYEAKKSEKSTQFQSDDVRSFERVIVRKNYLNFSSAVLGFQNRRVRVQLYALNWNRNERNRRLFY